MSYRVLLTEAAEGDLEAVFDFYRREIGSVRAGDLTDKLVQACRTLAAHPERGNIPAELGARGVTRYRELHVRFYRIVYRVSDDAVYIVAIVDGRRNVAAFLRERLER